MNSHDTSSISSRAVRHPRPGASTIPATVFQTPAHTTAEIPAFAKPAPTSPPMRACELDEGMPSRLVITCQDSAPVSAARMTRGVTISASTMPRPTVSATCRPNTRKAMKLKKAAQTTAVCGLSTRVDTTVAMALAASFMPLKKSNASATPISPTSSGNASPGSIGNWRALLKSDSLRLNHAWSAFLALVHDLIGKPVSTFPDHALDVLDDDAVHHVRDVVEAVDDLLQMIVNLVADDEGEPARVGGRLAVELVQAGIVHLVGLALQAGDLARDIADASCLVADRLEQRNGRLDQPGALDADVRHFLHLRRERLHIEQPNRLCGLLHLIDRIIHRRDQVADAAPVERCDERPANRDQNQIGRA